MQVFVCLFALVAYANAGLLGLLGGGGGGGGSGGGLGSLLGGKLGGKLFLSEKSAKKTKYSQQRTCVK